MGAGHLGAGRCSHIPAQKTIGNNLSSTSAATSASNQITVQSGRLRGNREEFPPHLFSRPLTDVGHVQAVLLGGVVPGGGGSRHVHAVGAPHGGVAAVEVAAVGPGRPVVRTLLPGPVSADTRGDGDASPHTIPGLPDHVMDKLFLTRSICV